MRGDAAAADMVGTTLMVALTVLLAVGLGALVYANVESTPSSPAAAFRVAAAAGSPVVTVTHAGGEALAMGDLTFAVRVDRADAPAAFDGKTGPGDSWRPGDAVRLRVASPVPAGAAVSVAVRAPGGLVGTAATVAPGGAAAVALATPTLTDLSFTPTNPPADGATAVNLTVRVETPLGLAALRSVDADLGAFRLGRVPLRDDGLRGDAAAADGVFTLLFEVPPWTPRSAHTVVVVARGADGGVARATALLDVIAPAWASGPAPGPRLAAKVGTGVSFDQIPTSANITRFLVENLTYDQAVPGLLQNDILLLKVIDRWNTSWTIDAQFANANGKISLRTLDMYSAKGGCSWAPRTLIVVDWPIDLLYPHRIGDMGAPSSSSPVLPTGLPPCTLLAPDVWTASYQNAGLRQGAVLTVLRLGDSTGADEKTGLINADVSFR